MGPFKAGFYQTFAALFGASLKKEYDPLGEDKLTERVVLLVEERTNLIHLVISYNVVINHHISINSNSTITIRKITPLYLTSKVLTVDLSGVNSLHDKY